VAIQPISKTRSIFLACFFTLSGLGCLWGLCVYVGDVRMSFDAADWPVVQGKIISSDVIRGCGKGSSYYPQVRYQYVVDAKIYMGQRVAFGNVGCGSNNSAQEIANRYCKNDIVSVHYNPNKPNEGVLIVAGVLNDTWVGIALLATMVIISSWLVSMSIRSWPRGSISKLQ
jgi:hypothetical protein